MLADDVREKEEDAEDEFVKIKAFMRSRLCMKEDAIRQLCLPS
jgi:hypothetical protein